MMSLFIAMCLFSLVMSASPGPVNMIIVSCSANYGLRKTLSFVSGATIGFIALLLLVGLGFSKVVNSYLYFLEYLSVVGALYISYLGIVIARAKPKIDIAQSNIPSFMQGVLLQWLNPKAWIACMVGVSLFSTAGNYQQFLTFSIIYFVICYLALLCWAVIGCKAAMLLNSEFKAKIFNQCLGGMLIVTAIFLLFI